MTNLAEVKDWHINHWHRLTYQDLVVGERSIWAPLVVLRPTFSSDTGARKAREWPSKGTRKNKAFNIKQGNNLIFVILPMICFGLIIRSSHHQPKSERAEPT